MSKTRRQATAEQESELERALDEFCEVLATEEGEIDAAQKRMGQAARVLLTTLRKGQ